MAGGIYTNKPFSFNLKCIVFGFLMILFYWLSARFSNGKPNYLLFIFIFIISYVGMAWYDYLYNCNTILRSGTSTVGMSTFDAIFKPQLRQKNLKDSVLNQERVHQKNVYLFHVLLISPILLFIGIQGIRGKINLNSKVWFVILLILGLASLLYHGYRVFSPRLTCNILTDNIGNITNITN